MAEYEIQYKEGSIGIPTAIELTKDQYYTILNYIDGKSDPGYTGFKLVDKLYGSSEPMKVKYLTKEQFEDVLEYLDVNKDESSMNKVKYSVVLKANVIKLVKKDYYKYLEKSILYGQCPLKFTKIKDRLFGNIEDGEVLINAEAYYALYPIFININSFASQYVIDTINKYILGDTKNYYLSYSFDKDVYRIHEKKPKRYDGVNSVTWQGQGKTVELYTDAYYYCKKEYSALDPFCNEISKEEYDKILNLINLKKDKKSNDDLGYYISYTSQYDNIYIHDRFVPIIEKHDHDTNKDYYTYAYLDKNDRVTYTHKIYPSNPNHSFLKKFYFKNKLTDLLRIDKVIYDFIKQNYNKCSANEFERGFYLLTSQTLNNKETNLQNNKKENNMTTKNTNEKKSMMSSMMSKFTSQFIPTEENDVKLSMDGNLVVKQGNEYVGIVGDKNELKSYPEEMCFDVPVYSINKPSKDVKLGDIIKRKNSYYKVTSIKDNGVLSLLSFSGNYTSSKEIKDAVLNQSFERVLFNYFNQTDNTPFNPMMLMFMKDSNVDMETLMMMSMMNQNGNSGFNFGNMFGNNSGMNPMMMLMLMKDKGESSMKDMMMLSMMGNMFNQNKQQ